jgi:hypothetical protein
MSALNAADPFAIVDSQQHRSERRLASAALLRGPSSCRAMPAPGRGMPRSISSWCGRRWRKANRSSRYFLALPENDPRVDFGGLRDPFEAVPRP